MANLSGLRTSNEMMSALSRLLLSERNDDPQFAATVAAFSNISREDFNKLVALANTNHVIVRGMEAFRNLMLVAQDFTRAGWADNAIATERNRIVRAIGFLQVICDTFRQERLDLTVMKSLDHWPDLGSDLDLYTNSDPEAVCAMMQKQFDAQVAARSWGDRLAGKWNFNIPGLPEPVEIHMQRLGQTGEQIVLASRLPSRSRVIEIENLSFRVPSASDRIMISTLQRMYRHFYFRLCDIVDSSSLIASGALDFDDLRYAAQAAGIWEGVATYLVIVSDYVRQYRGADLDLPKFVTDTARFGGDLVYFGRDFLRVPIMPQSAALYRTQLAGLLRKRELHSSARLGLLPWLATAAAVGQKITGSDKGIW
jgi:hypothetical protein